MYRLLPLIQNENMKIYRRIRTWIMLGIIVAINLLIAIILSSVDSGPVHHMLHFVSDSADLAAFFSVFIIVVAGDIVASEFTWGTIKMLLIRPVNRTKILLSKYIATLIFTFILLITLVLSSIVFGFLFFGTQGPIPADITIGSILGKYGLGLIKMIMTITFAFMISTVFRSSALAIALSFIILFVGDTITMILSGLNYNWGKYLLFANTDLAQYSEFRTPFFEGTSLGFSITVLIIYFIAFHFISWYIFKKRDVSI